MMSTGGQAIRVGVKDIPTLGRATQGVRIMKLNDSDAVASIGIIPKEEENVEAVESVEKASESSEEAEKVKDTK